MPQNVEHRNSADKLFHQAQRSKLLPSVTAHASFIPEDCILRRLTSDMSGGRKLAKPAGGRPLDGEVR